MTDADKKKQRVLAMLSGRGRSTLDGSTVPLLATVSGVATTKPALIKYVDQLGVFGIITTKSFQVLPNPGNREPILCEMDDGSYGNSVGLRNPGMEIAVAQLQVLRRTYRMNALLNVSVSASSPEDFITLVRCFGQVADIIELNFSCPHASAGYGSSIGCDPFIAASYTKAVCEAFPEIPSLLFVKLTPNVDNIGAVAHAVVQAGAHGLVAINTVGPEVHRDPVSGTPILQNKLGGKGGKSGAWIAQRALECIFDIRKAVGPDIPLIGVGGVSDGIGVAEMVTAGADAVGIGSAFAKVHQRQWEQWGKTMVRESQEILSGNKSTVHAADFLSRGNAMAYAKHLVVSNKPVGSDTIMLELDGEMASEAGQFAFLWLPGVGEKPFSVALSNPLTFLVKARGAVSQALCNLGPGDVVYLRGLYGEAVEVPRTGKALLVAGGTGVAVLPALARRLSLQGIAVETYVGLSDPRDGSTAEPLLKDELSVFGPYQAVCDNGVPARVLDVIRTHLHDVSDLAVYIVGPHKFMSVASALAVNAGIADDRIFLSMELQTMCGVGMCGECVCGDRLTCRWGTFVTRAYIAREAPELL